MVISKTTIQKIRELVQRRRDYILLKLRGREDLREKSYLERVYWHNYLNEAGASGAPTSFEEMKMQQVPKSLPSGEAHEASIEMLNSNLETQIAKQYMEVLARIEGFIHANNNEYKFNALQHLDRPESVDRLVKESTVGGLKRKLREYSGDALRNWDRVVNTEISNSIGLGSADRIVKDNKEKPADEVYVYRINPNDGATCKYCRQFYIDSDGSPKVYRMATLLGNGSNYGKKAADWLPVCSSTHPNCRDSQCLELRPGWKVLPGGRQTFIGLEAWKSYILEKVQG